MSVLLDVYVFIAWCGAWSTWSGAGAFFISILWTALLIFSVVASYVGGWLSIIMTILSAGSNLFLAPGIAIVAWFLYFWGGLGEWLSSSMPSIFPEKGYLFSEVKASLVELIILAAWAFMRFMSFKFMSKKCKFISKKCKL